MDPETRQIMKEIVARSPANNICFECGERSPQWMSVSMGVYVCLVCSGVHRSLGTHITFVQSLTMDKLKPIYIEKMRVGGNDRAAEFFAMDPSLAGLPNWKDKYFTHTAALYRDKIDALANGRSWDIDEARGRVPDPAQWKPKETTVSGFGASGSSFTPEPEVSAVDTALSSLVSGWSLLSQKATEVASITAAATADLTTKTSTVVAETATSLKGKLDDGKYVDEVTASVTVLSSKVVDSTLSGWGMVKSWWGETIAGAPSTSTSTSSSTSTSASTTSPLTAPPAYVPYQGSPVVNGGSAGGSATAPDYYGSWSDVHRTTTTNTTATVDANGANGVASGGGGGGRSETAPNDQNSRDLDDLFASRRPVDPFAATSNTNTPTSAGGSTSTSSTRTRFVDNDDEDEGGKGRQAPASVKPLLPVVERFDPPRPPPPSSSPVPPAADGWNNEWNVDEDEDDEELQPL